MPHIIVKMWTGQSETQKKELAEKLAKTASSVLGNREESFSVAIEEVDPKDWAEKVYRPDIVGQKEKLYKKPGYEM